jgi:hypothetical protein
MLGRPESLLHRTSEGKNYSRYPLRSVAEGCSDSDFWDKVWTGTLLWRLS